MQTYPHQFDNDCVCIHCGFDGAEASHLRKQGYSDTESECVPHEIRIPEDFDFDWE